MKSYLPETIFYEEYTITSDQSAMRVTDIHRWLSTRSHWAINIPYEVVATAVQNSFCVGVLKEGRQIGFARLITDYSIFAYLADVYVEQEHRGRGLSKKMMELMMGTPWVKNLRRILLATKDAHTLYEKYGFGTLYYPDRMMEIFKPAHYDMER
ncbi:MAG TPA: GNAT family N-acetyltransferase [Flavipsychrobacter sp.]|nr:GNAT family N-acetyltransferase [Flavipsychrobacter sp.]